MFAAGFPGGKTGLYSTRSGAFLCLDSSLAKALLTGKLTEIPPELLEEAQQKNILVPDDADELELVLAARRFNSTMFRILTTTACNAACSYCYEKGLPRQFMSLETAEETAAFLIRRREEIGAFSLLLEWFGGEPLLNPEVIDRICDRLHTQSVMFSSHMTTNCALMKPEMIEQIVERWALTNVQVSLDGVGAIHEQSKGMPAGTFQHILRCIQELLDKGCRVRLRIVHTGNMAQEAELIRFLGREFGDKKPYVYLFPLYGTKEPDMRRTMLEILELETLLVQSGLAEKEKMYRFHQRHGRCFAADGGLTIGPDGRLFSCSHAMGPEHCIGTVSNFDQNNPAYLEFISPALSRRCRECRFLPCCLGGCRTAELWRAEMFQCSPYYGVMDEVLLAIKKYRPERPEERTYKASALCREHSAFFR